MTYSKFFLISLFITTTLSFTVSFPPQLRQNKLHRIKTVKTNLNMMDSEDNDIESFGEYLERASSPSYTDYLEKKRMRYSKDTFDNIKTIDLSLYKFNNSDKQDDYTVKYKRPIPKIDLDTILLSISDIRKVYKTPNSDRYIIEYVDKSRGVYYINEIVDVYKVENLLNLINHPITVQVISDYGKIMDDMHGYLWCEEK